MAGCGQPFYMPLLWPIGNVVKAAKLPEDGKAQPYRALPILDVIGNVTAMLGAIRNMGLALLCIYYFHGDGYPAFGGENAMMWQNVWPIFARNIVGTWLICGSWDWFLYFSPFQKKLHKYKENHVYPSMKQMRHDAFYTTLASCWAACIEIALCYGWSRGSLPMQSDLFETPALNIFLALTITHWRMPHFHLMHRVMHPWRTTRIPDLGKVLYRHIHSLHHKSYNPTAFSGTSMHPIEATLYYTACLIPVALGLHPVFAVATIFDCGIDAWLSHDGFQWPGQGSYFHQLHHKHFDGNYGGMHVPLDYLFGTFISCKEDVKKVWGRKPAGEEANDTGVHEASKSTKVE